MRVFRKLWAKYEQPLKLYIQAQKEAESVVHRTPSLCLQLTGTRDQDHVPWGKWAKFESNCPVCKHASMMPMQSREAINAADALLHEEAKANGGDGKFEAAVNKVGCYSVLDKTGTEMMMALDVGGVWRWPGGRTTFHPLKSSRVSVSSTALSASAIARPPFTRTSVTRL
jgi:hypothetical protein